MYAQIQDSCAPRIDPGQSRGATTEQIEKFLESEKKQGISTATRSRDLKALLSALNLAKRRGYIEFNLASMVDEEFSDGEGMRKAFSLDQAEDLLKIVDDEWYGLILIGYCTGLRLGDASTLTWEQVDLLQKTITCAPHKWRMNQEAFPCGTYPQATSYLVQALAGGTTSVRLRG